MADEIRAKSFVVVDDDGRDRARLGMNGSSVGLELFGGGDEPAVSLHLTDDGQARLRMKKGSHIAELTVGEHKMSLELLSAVDARASCSMSVDDAGAWVVAEASPDIGVRLFSKNDGQVAFVGLAEHKVMMNEECVCTRFLRPYPSEDKSSGWQTE